MGPLPRPALPKRQPRPKPLLRHRVTVLGLAIS